VSSAKTGVAVGRYQRGVARQVGVSKICSDVAPARPRAACLDGRSTMRAGPPARRRTAVLAGLVVAGGALVPIVAINAAADEGPNHPVPSAANPTLAGPVTGGLGKPSLILANYPLSDVGYAETEYFFSGNASSYSNVGPLGSDGKWTAAPATSAAYKSRLVVVQPTDARHFSGNVVMEWFNVSGGADGAPDWSLGHNQIVRNGDAYVGVSAQAGGVTALKATDGLVTDPSCILATATPTTCSPKRAPPRGQYVDDASELCEGQRRQCTGGIRNPAVDAPIAVLSGLPPAASVVVPGFCVLFGQTIPLSPLQISALYPDRHDFAEQWRRSVRDGRRNGSLLAEDAKALEAVVAGD
jgi:hypothetical protein